MKRILYPFCFIVYCLSLISCASSRGEPQPLPVQHRQKFPP